MKQKRNDKNKTRVRRLLAAGLVLSLLVPQTAAAVEKPEDMEEERWERLQDNVLEYDELADRVAYFNPTICQIVDRVNDSFDTILENVDEYHEAINDLEYLYDKAVKQMDFDSVVEYKTNEMMFKYAARAMLKANKNRGKVIDRSTRQAKKTFTSVCQQLMVLYNKMAINKATLEKQVELYGKMAEMYETQAGIGMATQTQKLSAQASQYSAQNSLAALTAQMDELKRSLLLLLGWDYDSDVVVGSIPPVDVTEIARIDFAADKAIAPKNNYAIIEMKNAAPNDFDGDGKYKNKDYRAREQGVEQAEEQLAITIEQLYQTLFEQQAILASAETAYQAAQVKWDGAVRKYELGMLGQAEYLGEELAYCAAKAAYESAELDMRQAMLNYYWGVNGLGELA